MNDKILNPMYIDLSINPCDFMPKELMNDKKIKPLAKLFLMRLISLQVSGYKPFLSQKEFAEQQGVTRPTVAAAVTSLINMGILQKDRQREENLACEFYVNPEYMKSLGYQFRQKPIEESVVEEKSKVDSLASIFGVTTRTSYRKPDTSFNFDSDESNPF